MQLARASSEKATSELEAKSPREGRNTSSPLQSTSVPSAACLLRPQSSPVEGPLKAHNANLVPAMATQSVRARKLYGVLDCFRARRKEEDFVHPRRGKLREHFREQCPLLAWEAVIVQQASVRLRDDRLPNLRRTVPSIGHQHTTS